MGGSAMAFGLPACNECEMNKRNRLYPHLVRCTPPEHIAPPAFRPKHAPAFLTKFFPGRRSFGVLGPTSTGEQQGCAETPRQTEAGESYLYRFGSSPLLVVSLIKGWHFEFNTLLSLTVLPNQCGSCGIRS